MKGGWGILLSIFAYFLCKSDKHSTRLHQSSWMEDLPQVTHNSTSSDLILAYIHSIINKIPDNVMFNRTVNCAGDRGYKVQQDGQEYMTYLQIIPRGTLNFVSENVYVLNAWYRHCAIQRHWKCYWKSQPQHDQIDLTQRWISSKHSSPLPPHATLQHWFMKRRKQCFCTCFLICGWKFPKFAKPQPPSMMRML